MDSKTLITIISIISIAVIMIVGFIMNCIINCKRADIEAVKQMIKTENKEKKNV